MSAPSLHLCSVLLSLILQIHRRPKLLPPASSLLYTLKSTISVVPSRSAVLQLMQHICTCCAGHQRWRQRGWQQLHVLGLACPLPSRSSSVFPSSLLLTFGHGGRDAQIPSMPYRLGNSLITTHTTKEKYGNYHAAPGEKTRTKEQNTRMVVS